MDELVCGLSMAIAAPKAQHVDLPRQLQNDLFDVGADLTADEHWRVDATYVTRLEEHCDRLNGQWSEGRAGGWPSLPPASAGRWVDPAILGRADG